MNVSYCLLFTPPLPLLPGNQDNNLRVSFNGIDDASSPRFPSRPAPTRGGTWPNSIARGGVIGEGAGSGCVSGDSSLSRDSWTVLSGDGAAQRHKPFENPSMEKEYLHYIASVKQYLTNQHQNVADRNHALVTSGNDYSSKYFPISSFPASFPHSLSPFLISCLLS